jgi:hypothetical protein
MAREKIKVGDRIVFDHRVYLPPLAPHYDKYKGHVFTVVAFHYGGTHVHVEDEDEQVKVAGYIHWDDIRLADNCQVCHGKNGGVRGNENRENDIIMCDYCSAHYTRRK